MSIWSSRVDFPNYHQVEEERSVRDGQPSMFSAVIEDQPFSGFVDTAECCWEDDIIRVTFPGLMLKAELVDACRRIIEVYG